MRLANWQGENFTLNMAVSHNDFFRTLEAAMGEVAYSVNGLSVSAGDPQRPITLQLGPESVRQIALLRIANTDVTFTFEGYEQAAIDHFMSHFMARYQRGGG